MLLLKISSFKDNLEILLLMDLGICFLMLGGCLEFTLMYIRLSLGFLYGCSVPFIKSSSISKKFTTFRLALVV